MLGIEIQPPMTLFGPLLKIRVFWTYFGDYWFKLTPKVYLIYILPPYRAGLLWDRGGGRMQPQAKNGHTGREAVDKVGSPLAGISGGKRRLFKMKLTKTNKRSKYTIISHAHMCQNIFDCSSNLFFIYIKV